MKDRIVCLALASILPWLSACDGTTKAPLSSGEGGSRQIAHILDVSGRLDQSRAGTASIRVAVAGKAVVPDAQGAYRILDTVYVEGASRVRASDAGPDDTVRILVGEETVRNIPITTWSAVLPTNYIVQRNVGVEVAAKHAGSKLEAVWWSNDSIANTVVLGQGTSSRKYSGYIYNVYDDAMFGSDAHLYWLFVRITNTYSLGFDSVVAYTNVTDVTAKDGDQIWDSTQFDINTRFKTLGYTLVPDDSSVAVYSKTKTVVMVLDSVVVLDTVVADSAHGFALNIISTSNPSFPLTTTLFESHLDIGANVTVVTQSASLQSQTRSLSVTGDTVKHTCDPIKVVVGFNAQDTGSWGLNDFDFMESPKSIKAGHNAYELDRDNYSFKFKANTDVTDLTVKFVVKTVVVFYRR